MKLVSHGNLYHACAQPGSSLPCILQLPFEGLRLGSAQCPVALSCSANFSLYPAFPIPIVVLLHCNDAASFYM